MLHRKANFRYTLRLFSEQCLGRAVVVDVFLLKFLKLDDKKAHGANTLQCKSVVCSTSAVAAEAPWKAFCLVLPVLWLLFVQC